MGRRHCEPFDRGMLIQTDDRHALRACGAVRILKQRFNAIHLAHPLGCDVGGRGNPDIACGDAWAGIWDADGVRRTARKHRPKFVETACCLFHASHSHILAGIWDADGVRGTGRKHHPTAECLDWQRIRSCPSPWRPRGLLPCTVCALGPEARRSRCDRPTPPGAARRSRISPVCSRRPGR